MTHRVQFTEEAEADLVRFYELMLAHDDKTVSILAVRLQREDDYH